MKANVELDRLVQRLKNFRIEFEKYFNGALDIPPGHLQFEIDQEIRRLRERVKGSINKFRLQSLEAQFNAYAELFNRRLRDREEGRSRAKTPTVKQTAHDPRSGVLVDEEPDESAVAALYQGLYSASAGTKHVDLESFRDYLGRQVSMIREKTGCTQVQFRLTDEEGRVKLKAKPIRRDSD